MTKWFRLGPVQCVLCTALSVAGVASASSVYVALGDSITFGETDLNYVQSNGNRGYVADIANSLLAGRNGGIAPTVFNLAIDGETASSFMTGMGRTPPVMGRTDSVLAAQNSNYAGSPGTTQLAAFQSLAGAQKSAGNTISTVSITLGFNELGALATLPTSQALARLPSTLAAYQMSYGQVLTDIRSLLPAATLYVLGYFNPFPADPNNPAGPFFAQAGPQANNIIQQLASQYNGVYVGTSGAFLGQEAALTYMGQYPAGSIAPGSQYVGVEPIGNVHPNNNGYAVIANQIAAVPEPGTIALMAIAGLGLLAFRRASGRRPV